MTLLSLHKKGDSPLITKKLETLELFMKLRNKKGTATYDCVLNFSSYLGTMDTMEEVEEAYHETMKMLIEVL